MDFNSLPRVGPYMYISHDEKKRVRLDGKMRTFRILLYGAYNAMGLIGSECNGIAVLDEDNLSVVSDEICRTGSGWGGPSTAQRMEYRGILKLKGPAFRALANGSRRSRYNI